MNTVTQALHCRVDQDNALSTVTPLFQCSAFDAGSPYFYTRKNNPNVAEFEAVIATLEGAEHAIALTTGMAAISGALELLCPGETLVINKDIYGCSYKLFQRVANRLGLSLHVLDLSIEANLSQVPDDTRMIVFETPTNPFLKTVDIQSI